MRVARLDEPHLVGLSYVLAGYNWLILLGLVAALGGETYPRLVGGLT